MIYFELRKFSLLIQK